MTPAGTGGSCANKVFISTRGSIAANQLGGSVTQSANQGKTYTATTQTMDLNDCTFEFPKLTYDGTAKEPSIKITGSDNKVYAQTLCTVTYENNINAGTATAKLVSKDPNTSGNYMTGKKDVTFTIDKAAQTGQLNVSKTSVEFTDTYVVSLSGAKETPEVTWTVAKGEAELSSQTNSSVVVKPIGVTDVVVKAELKTTSNYLAQEISSAAVKVTPKSISVVSWDAVAAVTYTGKAQTPVPTGKCNGVTVTKDKHFTVTYSQNINAGTGKITITGKTYLKDTKELSFIINPKNIGEVTAAAPKDVVYNGKAQQSKPTLTYNGMTLTEGTDYTLSFSADITNCGQKLARATGKGNYTKTKDTNYNITQASLKNNSLLQIGKVSDLTFTGNGQTPDVPMTYNSVVKMKLNTDYTLSYTNNVTAGTATVTIAGKGNFKDSTTTTFQVVPREITATVNMGQWKYYGQTDSQVHYGQVDSQNPSFSYTVTNTVDKYVPVFTGKLERDEGETVRSYDVKQGTLALDSTAAVNKNYTLKFVSKSFEIRAYYPEAGYTLTGTLNQDTGWYWKDYVQVAPKKAGFTISASDSLTDNEWNPYITYPDKDYSEGDGAIYYVKAGAGMKDGSGRDAANAISVAEQAHYQQDTVDPIGNITLGNTAWQAIMDTLGFGTYLRSQEKLHIYGTDYTSGIEEISYLTRTEPLGDGSGSGQLLEVLKKLPESDWTQGEELTVENARTILYARLRDRAGNVTYLNTDGIIFDDTKPVINTVYPYDKDTWCKDPDVVISGTIVEKDSLLKDHHVEWKKNGSGQSYLIDTDEDGNFTIGNLPDGQYDVVITAEDNAGNEADPVRIPVWKDTENPEVEVTVDGGSGWQSKPKVTVSFTASDTISGMGKWSYSLNGGEIWSAEQEYNAGASFDVTVDGLYQKTKPNQICLRVRDAAGNTWENAPGAIEVRKDVLAPAVPGYSVTDFGRRMSEGTLWYRSGKAPEISLTAPVYNPVYEAPNHVQWKLYPKGTKEPDEWTTDGTPVLAAGGVYTLQYRTRDEAGNVSAETEQTISWDNSNPSFDTTQPFTFTPVGGTPLEQVGNAITLGNFFKEGLKVKVHVTDTISGLDSVTYTVSGREPVTVSGDTFTITKDMAGRIVVIATDKAGNVSSETVLLNQGSSDGDHWVFDDRNPVIGDVSANAVPNGEGWYSKHLELSSNITDSDGGLNRVEYQLGTAAAQTETLTDSVTTSYDWVQTLSEEGEKLPVTIKAVDNAGNESNVTYYYNIDTVAPEMTLKIEDPVNGNGWRNSTVLLIDAKDPAPDHGRAGGLKSYSYSLDQGLTWSEDFPYQTGEDGSTVQRVPIEKDGKLGIVVRVFDRADNVCEKAVETTDSLQDRTPPPEAVLTITGTSVTSSQGEIWYTDATEPKISLTVAQAGSDESPNHVYWKLWKKNGTEPSDYHEDGTVKLGDQGDYVLKYYTEDEAGNATGKDSPKTVPVRWDGTAPKFADIPFTYQTVGGSSIEKLGNFLSFGNFFKEGIEVTVHFTEPDSGLEKLAYTIDGRTPVEINGNKFILPKGTAGYITVQAIDYAGNKSEQMVCDSQNLSNYWMIEDGAPVIEKMTTSLESYQTKLSDGREEIWYTNDIPLTAGVVDQEGALKSVSYRIGDRDPKIFDLKDSRTARFDIPDLVMDLEGRNVPVVIEAVDAADNKSTDRMTFNLDKIAPEVTLTVVSPADYKNTWTNQDVKIQITASDPAPAGGGEASGVRYYSCSQDGGATWRPLSDYDWTSVANNYVIIENDGVYARSADSGVRIRVWDTAGNFTETTMDDAPEAHFDKTAPPRGVLSVEPGQGGSRISVDGKDWYSGDKAPVVSLSVEKAGEKESPNHVMWRFYKNGTDVTGLDWIKDETEKIIVPAEGVYVLEYYTIDEAGNATDKDAPVTAYIRWDNTAPTFDDEAFTFGTKEPGVVADILKQLGFGNFAKEEIQVTVHATDATKDNTAGHVSGIKSVSYSLNGGEPVEAAGSSFTLPVGTTGQVTVWLTDYAGNISSSIVAKSTGEADWVLENQPPLISEITTDHVNIQPFTSKKSDGSETYWYNTDLPLFATVTDNGSGLAEVTWKVGSRGEQTKTFPTDSKTKTYSFEDVTDFILAEEGEAVEVTITAIDQAGNESRPKTQTFNIDKTNPKAIPKLAEPASYDGKTQWTNREPQVEVSASDALSGVAFYSYSTDGGNTWSSLADFDETKPENNRFAVKGDGIYGNGEREILVRVWDRAGNTWTSAPSESPDIRLDQTPPPESSLAVTPDATGEKTDRYGELWTNGEKAPSLTVSCEAAKAACASHQISWKLYEKGEAADAITWTEDGSQPVIPNDKEGVYQIEYRTVDSAGNSSAVQNGMIRYDRTVPEFGTGGDETTAFQFEETGETTLEKLGNFLTFGNFFKEAVRVKVTCGDSLSGIGRMQYELNDKKPVDIPLEGPMAYQFDLPKGTEGIIVVTATDKAGNQKSLTLTGEKGSTHWRIGENVPEIHITPVEEANAAGWYCEDVVLDVDVKTAAGGLYQVELEYNESTDTKNFEEGRQEGDAGATPSNAYQRTVTLIGEGDSLKVRALAVNNDMAQNMEEKTYRIDRTKPEITCVGGFPEKLVKEQPTVSFTVSDSLSGVDEATISMVRDRDLEERAELTVTAVKQEDGSYVCTAPLKGNGEYTIMVSDLAGNPAEEFRYTETHIDDSIPNGAKVKITPKDPDGESSWYVSTPSIALKAPKQQGVSKIAMYYSLEPAENPDGPEAGEGTPSDGNQAEEHWVLYEKDKPETYPVIKHAGVWNFKVRTENELGVPGAWLFERTLYIDTNAPEDVAISGVPEDWVNQDVPLTVTADSEESPLSRWRYTTDGGSTYSGWIDWKEENGFTLNHDIDKEGQIFVEVEDLAGNHTTGSPVNVWRDTVRPKLTIASPANAEVDVPVTTQLILTADEAVETKRADGSLRIYDGADGSLWGEIPSDSPLLTIEEAEKKTVTVKLPYALTPYKRYYAVASENFLTDHAGNPSPLLGGKNEWQFRTEQGEADVGLDGYELTLLSRATTSNADKMQMIQAAAISREDMEYSVLVKPEYAQEDGSNWTNLIVSPRYQEGVTDVSLTVDQPSVRAELLEDKSFTLLIPPECESVKVTLTLNGTLNSHLTVATAGTRFKAEAEGVYRPEIDEGEVLNSLNLSRESTDPKVTKVVIALEADTGKEVERFEAFKPGSAVSINLDLKLTKTVYNDKGQSTVGRIVKLQNPITITLDRPEESRRSKYTSVMRLHNGVVTLIDPEFSEDGNRISFKTDRFSDYSIVCSNEFIRGTSSSGGGSSNTEQIREKTVEEIIYQDVIVPGEQTEAASERPKGAKEPAQETVKSQDGTAVETGRELTKASASVAESPQKELTITASEQIRAACRRLWQSGGGWGLILFLLLIVLCYLLGRGTGRKEEEENKKTKEKE